jgi:hypothetical protein
MAKIVTIGTETFEIPQVGSNPDYGSELTDFFVAIADALANVQEPNDILKTTANIANNITVPTNIPAFSFDTSEVVSINAEYIVKRTTTTPPENLTESGIIRGNFDGSNWTITIESEGNSGILFSITPGGQIQYTSSNMIGASYSGEIIFKAKVFNET